jgi:uncharacterized protein YecT (DUF1311 family)
MRRTLVQVMLCVLVSAVGPIYASGQRDPCPESSNAEMRECYTQAQSQMNKRADELAARIVEDLRTPSPKDLDFDSPAIVKMLLEAAQKVENSQVRWRAYRDEYCSAIVLSYTTGSGAGTAYEHCMYSTAAARVQELLYDFGDPAKDQAHPH